MIQTNQNEQVTKVANWVAVNLDKYEVILVLVSILVLVLKMAANFPVGTILVMLLSTLAILYYFKAFSVMEDENAGGLERFVEKLSGYACSIGIIGILFRLENWQGYKQMLFVSCLFMLVLIPTIVILRSRKPELKLFNQRLLVRMFLIGATGLILYISTNDALVKYRIIKNTTIEITSEK